MATAERYTWFRRHGCRAEDALRAARAEELAAVLNLAVEWFEEEERYVDVYGELPGDDTQERIDRGEVLCLYGVVRGPDREVLDSLGMVTVTGWSDPYLREEGANLLIEAVGVIRRRVEGSGCC